MKDCMRCRRNPIGFGLLSILLCELFLQVEATLRTVVQIEIANC